MSPPPTLPQPPAWVVVALLIGALTLFGLAPYLEIVEWLPWGADATKWVIRGSPDDPNWWRWSTQSKHFVGYRPVTALSFALNHAITGYAAFGYRATDLALHLAAGALTFAAYRGLTGDRSLFGLVPVIVLLLHPATEEVVPHVARRSYNLAAVFGLGALVAQIHALRGARPHWGWVLLAVELLVLALLSNEIAFVMAPVLALVALNRGLGRRDAAIVVSIVAIAVVIVVARRYEVLGTFGGYSKRYFAYVSGGGVPRWRELASWQPGVIADTAWRYALSPSSVAGAAPLFPGTAGLAAVALFTSWLAWVGIAVPAGRREEPEARARWICVAWILGAIGIIVASQTWFWRQAVGVLPPLGILIGIGLRDGIAGLRRREFGQLPGLVVGVGLLASVVRHAPLPTLHRSAHREARLGTPVVATVDRLIAQIEGPAVVQLVVPLRSQSAHIARIWAGRRKDEVQVHVLAHPLSRRPAPPRRPHPRSERRPAAARARSGAALRRLGEPRRRRGRQRAVGGAERAVAGEPARVPGRDRRR